MAKKLPAPPLQLPRKHPFVYTSGGHSTSARRKYIDERKKAVSYHCDNPECILHMQEPRWNGQPLTLELDHVNGVNSNDVSDNLRLLCPNCHSLQPTKSGKNKGKVRKSDGGFAVPDRETGLYQTTAPVEPGEYRIGQPAVHVVKYRLPPSGRDQR